MFRLLMFFFGMTYCLSVSLWYDLLSVCQSAYLYDKLSIYLSAPVSLSYRLPVSV
jgi:hypothetical protein